VVTVEERAQQVQQLQENTQAVYRMLMSNQITGEQGRIAADLLQLMFDLIDLADSLERRSQLQ
jgi:hypothetical protein